MKSSVMKKIKSLKNLSISEYNELSDNIRNEIKNYWAWEKKNKKFP